MVNVVIQNYVSYLFTVAVNTNKRCVILLICNAQISTSDDDYGICSVIRNH